MSLCSHATVAHEFIVQVNLPGLQHCISKLRPPASFITKGQQTLCILCCIVSIPDCYAPAAEVNEQFTFQHAA